MEKKIFMVQYSAEQLQEVISAGVKRQLDEFSKHFQPKQPNEYLTKRQVADLFNVDISTVHSWAKSNKIKPLGMGSRVYFLRSQIEESLIPLNQ
ncbi:helix-turn-helix domain-containing protein [Flavobacterium taihuense]|nr:helix-turn-helix domain-containing protein [Flavobacterium taihuense]